MRYFVNIKKAVFILAGLALFSCKSMVPENTTGPLIPSPVEFKQIALEKHVTDLASDNFEGRKTGERGQKSAAAYLAKYYRELGISPPPGYTGYYQEIPLEFIKHRSKHSSENVIAFVPGTEKPEEVIVLSSHYDHLGIRNGKIYHGADDNASGTAALMEIARNFMAARAKHKGPKRSVLFLHLSGEEEGLLGSKYYVKHPAVPLNKTMVNLNIDMIGRIDPMHQSNPNYIYIIGSDKMSSLLHRISEAVNKNYVGLELDYTYNDENDPNRFYYRSDHYNFIKNGIPAIFYFNGTHKDYHKSTDTADKIDLDILSKRTALIFYTAWELANMNDWLKVDKK